MLDVERGVPSRITSSASFYADPRWADSRRILATRWSPLPQAIVQISPEGAESVIVTSAVANMVESASRDGRYLLNRERGQTLLAVPLADGSKLISVHAVAAGSINQARFSDDTRWIAYQEADPSGQFEVYVTRFPPTGERWRVSARGGVQPVWCRDSRELYYLGLDGTLNAVELRPGNPPRFSTPKGLFPTGLCLPLSRSRNMPRA